MRRIVGDPLAERVVLPHPKHLYTILSLMTGAIATGCGDRLTGPEVAQLVDAAESSRLTTAEETQRQQFWDIRLGALGGHKSSLLRAASEVVVRRGGRMVAYRGLVQEVVRVPASPLACLGTNWDAIFWNVDREHAWLTFRGADFSRRIEARIRWRSDCNHVVSGPEPFLYVSEGDSNWVAIDGLGDVSQGDVIGECPFLTPDAAVWLRENRGMTCELTRHKVWFHAQLERANSQLRPVVEDSSTASEIDLASTEIIGVRMTFRCDGTERTKDVCPRKLAP